MIKQWMGKIADDGDNASFLASFTKECPKCDTLIHKDGGCQYMTCSKCNHRFCWICLGAFDHRSHACNQYKDDGKDKNSARAMLNKFMHFFKRFFSRLKIFTLILTLCLIISLKIHSFIFFFIWLGILSMNNLPNWRISY
eukprot:TRINITY_DN4163_c0_g1_i2.p1 TRINITY_DN4163_c0_g1~~TRINITY_DN4163_c0_g1_i2.p1  ORF type:complete len:140 (-),score=6.18 TRINITY_DN4163_c0_g1_i2:244-663(-)